MIIWMESCLRLVVEWKLVQKGRYFRIKDNLEQKILLNGRLFRKKTVYDGRTILEYNIVYDGRQFKMEDSLDGRQFRIEDSLGCQYRMGLKIFQNKR